MDWNRKEGSGKGLQICKAQNDLPYLSFGLLEESGMVKHCFTTREGGVSEGIFSSLNLSFTRGDREEAVRENFRRVSEAFEIPMERFVFTDQTHTDHVRVVTAEDAGKGLTRQRDYTDVDALITNEPGLMLSAFFADCVPLYFVDPLHRAIGLAHSGWRGTVAGIGAKTIEKMTEVYGSRPQDLLCAIGPSICRDCYEVGEEVAEEFEKVFGTSAGSILKKRNGGKYDLDLWEANRIILTEAGVPKEQIAVTDLCTCCNEKMLFSHRASAGKRGNLAAFLCLK